MNDFTLANGLLVPATYRPRTLPTCVDLFCGAGGFSLGMMKEGFHVIAACDNDAAAAVSYLYNLGTYPCNIQFLDDEAEERFTKHLEKSIKLDSKGKPITPAFTSGGNRRAVLGDHPGVGVFFFGDVRKLTGEMICKATGKRRGEIDCLVGGPPCQGFSRANNKRNVMDPRNSLVFEFTRLVLEIQPKSMVMENVPELVNMMTPEGEFVIDAISRVLQDGGWNTMEAVRRTLEATSGVGAAYRNNTRKETPSAKEEVGQMTLFGKESTK